MRERTPLKKKKEVYIMFYLFLLYYHIVFKIKKKDSKMWDEQNKKHRDIFRPMFVG